MWIRAFFVANIRLKNELLRPIGKYKRLNSKMRFLPNCRIRVHVSTVL